MNQLIAVALGGACGAVIRFLMSTGLYHWLGRGFPYGTLAVNVVGSFLIGLLTEALILQRITISFDYRAAILVGFIGAFTTFSTFSLETLYLIEQGSLNKAALNIVVSVLGCLFAVWIGLLCGRYLFLYSGGMIHWSGGVIPYALMIVNAIGAFLIGIIATDVVAESSPFHRISCRHYGDNGRCLFNFVRFIFNPVFDRTWVFVRVPHQSYVGYFCCQWFKLYFGHLAGFISG